MRSAWFHYIFDPTRQSADPAPQRFWITKPLYDLTSARDYSRQRINNLLLVVGEPGRRQRHWRGSKVGETTPSTRSCSPTSGPVVAYMKRTVMSYLDNLIAWADNLFATDSREAAAARQRRRCFTQSPRRFSDPQPAAVDAAEARRRIVRSARAQARRIRECDGRYRERDRGGAGGGGGSRRRRRAAAGPQTFYFKIPPNDTAARLLDAPSPTACSSCGTARTSPGRITRSTQAVRRADRSWPA